MCKEVTYDQNTRTKHEKQRTGLIQKKKQKISCFCRNLAEAISELQGTSKERAENHYLFHSARLCAHMSFTFTSKLSKFFLLSKSKVNKLHGQSVPQSK